MVDKPSNGDAVEQHEVEEITLGLPAETPKPAHLTEYCQVNRYLLQNLRRMERELLARDRVDAVLLDVIDGTRRLLGCTQVEVWLHDPVGYLAEHIDDDSRLEGSIRLTEDSYDIASLFGEPVSAQWMNAELAGELGLFNDAHDKTDIFIVPMVESGHVVGSLHLLEPQQYILADEADLDLLFDFAAFVPGMLRSAMAAQQASELMLVDPVTKVANRNGLLRDIEREIDRARRGNRSVSLVALTLCGLESMGNLSQRHMQAQVLRQVAGRLTTRLRGTDAMGRADAACFALLMPDAQVESVPDIAWRYEQSLRGQTLDDGMGGVFEIDPCGAYLSVDPADYPDRNNHQLAAMMVDAVVSAANCDDRCSNGLRAVQMAVDTPH